MTMQRILFKTFTCSTISRHCIFKNLKIINFNLFKRSSYLSNFIKNKEEEKYDKNNFPDILISKDYLKVSSKNCDQPYVIPEKDKEIVEKLKKGDILWPYKSPSERFVKIVSEDLKISSKKIINTLTSIELGDLKMKYFPRHADFVIIGGGAIGLSIAYAIQKNCSDEITTVVVDKLLEPNQSTTNLGTGTLLQQNFIEQEEIQMSKYCAEFFATFERQFAMAGHLDFSMPYEPLGSLFLADETSADKLLKKIELLDQYEIPYKLLKPSEIKSKFPWLNIDGVVLGTLGMLNEGIYDPWTYLKALKCKLKNLNVSTVKAEVIDFGFQNQNVRRVLCRLPDGSYNTIDFSICIITGGIQSKRLINILNNAEELVLKLKLPLEEKKRYEYCFFCENGPGLNSPIIMEPDGTYFRREGLKNLYVAGVSSVSGDGSENFEEEVYNLLETKIKPFMIKRVPNIKDVVLKNGWIDFFDTNSANNVGIIGPHPYTNRLYFALGFAQHGMQYAPAVGNAIMEHIVWGEYKTIDLTPFHIENLYLKQHLEYDKKLILKQLEELDRNK